MAGVTGGTLAQSRGFGPTVGRPPRAVGQTCFKHFSNIFQTFSKHFSNIFQTSFKHFSNIFKQFLNFPEAKRTFLTWVPNSGLALNQGLGLGVSRSCGLLAGLGLGPPRAGPQSQARACDWALASGRRTGLCIVYCVLYTVYCVLGTVYSTLYCVL
jgi:hypothetical protein